VRITTRSDPRPKLHKPAAALKPLRLHRVQDNSHSQLYTTSTSSATTIWDTRPCPAHSYATSFIGTRNRLPCSASAPAPGPVRHAMTTSAGPTSSAGETFT
jgi:hypothetical protein